MTKMSRNRKEVAAATFVAVNNHLDTDDLVIMLEITPEDILERFEDRLLEHRDKFVPDGYIMNEEDYDEQDQEEAEATERLVSEGLEGD